MPVKKTEHTPATGAHLGRRAGLDPIQLCALQALGSIPPQVAAAHWLPWVQGRVDLHTAASAQMRRQGVR